MGLEVLDKIGIKVADTNELVNKSVGGFGDYIQSETQALSLEVSKEASTGTVLDMDDFELAVLVEKA